MITKQVKLLEVEFVMNNLRECQLLWDNMYKGKTKWSYEEIWLAERRHQIIMKYLAQINAKKIKFLEVGFGTGINLKLLENFDNNYKIDIFGVELSDNALKFAEKNLIKSNLIKGDALSLPFKDNSFDIVYSAGLIEHFKDMSTVVNEMYRCVKKGGYLILTVPGYSLFYIYKIIAKIFGFWKLGYERNFTMKSLIKEMKNIGIKGENMIESGAIGTLGLCFATEIIFRKLLSYNKYKSIMNILDKIPRIFPKEIYLVIKKED